MQILLLPSSSSSSLLFSSFFLLNPSLFSQSFFLQNFFPSPMDSRVGPHFRNVLLNLVNHHQTNLAITALLAFLSLYIAFAALFDRSLFHPLTPSSSSSPILPQDNSSSSSASPPPSSFSSSSSSLFRPFSLFLLWCLSLAFGHIFRLLFLPFLLGPLLVGILLANFASFSSLLPPPGPLLSSFIFEFAFLLILLRSALGINPLALRRQLAFSISLGILCPLVECLCVVLITHFVFDVPVAIAILFSFALSASSPAVIVPPLLWLKSNDFGIESGVPSVLLCSVSLDNVFLLTGFSVAFQIVSSASDELSYTLSRIPAELLVGAILGILAGLFLRSFPRPDAHLAHFQRTFLLLSAGIAFHFGTRAIGCSLAGPVAVLLMASTAAMHWQLDNHRGTRLVENGLQLLWDLFASPLLFLLLGTLLLISSPSFFPHLLGPSLGILLLSLAIRFVSSLASSFCCFGPSAKERLFLAICLLPKATLQASLGPFLLQFISDEFDGQKADLLGQTLLLAILLCAPLGELAIRLFGPLLLDQKLLPSAGASIVPLGPSTTMMGNTMAKGKITHSDPKDNKLRLELGPMDPADPPNTGGPTTTTTTTMIVSPPASTTNNNYQHQQQQQPHQPKPMRDFQQFREKQRAKL